MQASCFTDKREGSPEPAERADGRPRVKSEHSEEAPAAEMGNKASSLPADRTDTLSNDARPSVSEREPTAELLGEGPSNPGVPCR